MNRNENMAHQNIWDTMIATGADIKTSERSQIYN